MPTEYDADVQHLAEYVLRSEPYTAATRDEHERRVHALARAVQDTVDAWLDSHPRDVERRAGIGGAVIVEECGCIAMTLAASWGSSCNRIVPQPVSWLTPRNPAAGKPIESFTPGPRA